jgi:hypothetical protein
MRRIAHILCTAGMVSLTAALAVQSTTGAGVQSSPAEEVRTPPPPQLSLEPVDITKLPAGMERLDLFLLMGQSNMKGRGLMPKQPSREPRIVMMHLKDDRWYVARHPLHLVGDAKAFDGADNAGVGPGLAFAESLLARDSEARIGLIPCAVGGTSIELWQKGGKLYEEALRRARLALKTTAPAKGRIRGMLWLQGEANANEKDLPRHEARLLKLVDDMRADLEMPELPFIACTIGEMRSDARAVNRAAMNEILLALPSKRLRTACVDARDLKTHIGDFVHFDAAAQKQIGRRCAARFIESTQGKSGGK